MNNPTKIEDDEMQAEYDFSGGVRGKYSKRLAKPKPGKTVVTVVLDPDVAKYFHDSAAVNDALRALIKVANQQVAQSA